MNAELPRGEQGSASPEHVLGYRIQEGTAILEVRVLLVPLPDNEIGLPLGNLNWVAHDVNERYAVPT
jgi:hypothetical protein